MTPPPSVVRVCRRPRQTEANSEYFADKTPSACAKKDLSPRSFQALIATSFAESEVQAVATEPGLPAVVEDLGQRVGRGGVGRRALREGRDPTHPALGVLRQGRRDRRLDHALGGPDRDVVVDGRLHASGGGVDGGTVDGAGGEGQEEEARHGGSGVVHR
jgi:hypothetical protein